MDIGAPGRLPLNSRVMKTRGVTFLCPNLLSVLLTCEFSAARGLFRSNSQCAYCITKVCNSHLVVRFPQFWASFIILYKMFIFSNRYYNYIVLFLLFDARYRTQSLQNQATFPALFYFEARSGCCPGTSL